MTALHVDRPVLQLVPNPTPTVADVMEAIVAFGKAEREQEPDAWMYEDSPAIVALRHVRRLVERMYDERYVQGVRALEGGTR